MVSLRSVLVMALLVGLADAGSKTTPKKKVYVVAVTSKSDGSNTDGDVQINVKMQKGNSGWESLDVSGRDDFQRGAIDRFTLKVPFYGTVGGFELRIGSILSTGRWWKPRKACVIDPTNRQIVGCILDGYVLKRYLFWRNTIPCYDLKPMSAEKTFCNIY